MSELFDFIPPNMDPDAELHRARRALDDALRAAEAPGGRTLTQWNDQQKAVGRAKAELAAAEAAALARRRNASQA